MDDMEALAHMEVSKPMPPPAWDLEQVFREHHAMVFRTAYRITGSNEDAEDVLQTVFLRLARREDDAAAVDHLPGYLRRAAINAAFDLLRSRQRTPSLPLEDLEPVLPDHAIS